MIEKFKRFPILVYRHSHSYLGLMVDECFQPCWTSLEITRVGAIINRVPRTKTVCCSPTTGISFGWGVFFDLYSKGPDGTLIGGPVRIPTISEILIYIIYTEYVKEE